MKWLTVLFVLAFVVLTFPSNYALYYTAFPQQNTGILITNVYDERANYRIEIYDSDGYKLWSDSRRLDPYVTDFIDVAETVGTDEYNWGLALIKSDELLYIGAMYMIDEEVIAYDNVLEPIQEDENAKYYWYGMSFHNLAEGTSGIVISNPNNEECSISIWVYDSDGTLIYEDSGFLYERESAYFDLSEELYAEAVGVVDVRSDLPIIIGAEYYKNGDTWEIDNVVDWYSTTPW